MAFTGNFRLELVPRDKNEDPLVAAADISLMRFCPLASLCDPKTYIKSLILGKIARAGQILGTTESHLITAQVLRIVAELLSEEKGFSLKQICSCLAGVRSRWARSTTWVVPSLLRQLE